jgi:hypothetical protein
LETQTAFGRLPRPPEVIINDNNCLTRPAELEGPIYQRVLQSCGLLVPFNLLRCGLSDVNHRCPLAVTTLDFVES